MYKCMLNVSVRVCTCLCVRNYVICVRMDSVHTHVKYLYSVFIHVKYVYMNTCLYMRM